jgi:hypothetical protein
MTNKTPTTQAEIDAQIAQLRKLGRKIREAERTDKMLRRDRLLRAVGAWAIEHMAPERLGALLDKLADNDGLGKAVGEYRAELQAEAEEKKTTQSVEALVN